MAVRPAVTAPNVSLLSCDSISNDALSELLSPSPVTDFCEQNGDEPRDSQRGSLIGGPDFTPVLNTPFAWHSQFRAS